MKKIYFLITALLLCLQLSAQDDNLIMRFDFNNVSGNNVTDDLSGITAKIMSSASIKEMGEYNVLDLGNNNGYLDMTEDAGKLLAKTGAYTISVYYYVDEKASLNGNGFFLWTFSTLEGCSSNAGNYMAYRLNLQRIASSTGGFTKETGFSVGEASPKGSWMHVAYTQQAGTGKLYINGELKATISNMPANSTLFKTPPPYCWIGRPHFGGDNYLKQTLVYDFRLYNKALSETDVEKLSYMTSNLNDAYLFGSKGNPTALKAAIQSAENILNNSNGYLPDAIAELKGMVEYAKNIAEGNFSQSYMDDTQNLLTSIITSVKASKGITLPTVTGLIDAYDKERGFKHPGGLHTQEDFDRIKRQLEEGNEKVTEAYQILKKADFAQPGIKSSPTEYVVRGGTGENYMNAARGATMAYQNALRWKIEGNEACAKTAVDILMSWARVTKGVTGDTNSALASGLYGYPFAQAAELVRDYEGWSQDDFEEFKQWMIRVWYRPAISFLRTRHGSWENSGKWWTAPGHYWSNWPLCNIMCAAIIGILCDDVYIYNQAMSFFKYDQVGNYRDTPVLHTVTGHGEQDGLSAIYNDGLTDFLGNLVVTNVESDIETGAYGRLGQMNESGRDAGHSAMAAGLMIDVAKIGWNQGDDLFAYMDHRVASGIEFIAGQTQSMDNLPWTNYLYISNGYAASDSRSWLMTEPAMGTHIRPYWGTVIGIYEGVKGVKMPLSEKAYEAMGIDAGAQGATSGGYDHMGYSVLMNTRDIQLCPADKVPTELSGKIEYSGNFNSNLIPSLSVEKTRGKVNGNVISHNELGGLVNTYKTNFKTCVPKGNTLTLMPELPEGEEDTGKWKWDTGENTRNITVTSDKSFIYRVTYTNKNGIESQQCFIIAVEGDCQPTKLTPTIITEGMSYETNNIDIMYGQTPTLSVKPSTDWGEFVWSTGQKTDNITIAPVVTPREYTVYYTNQGAGVSALTFHINVIYARPIITTNSGILQTNKVVVDAGESVTLGVEFPTTVSASDMMWNTGDRGAKLVLDDIRQSGVYTATFKIGQSTATCTFYVYVKDSEQKLLEPGYYVVLHRDSGRLLTSNGQNEFATFDQGDIDEPRATQIWNIDNNGKRHIFKSFTDEGFALSYTAKLIKSQLFVMDLTQDNGLGHYSMAGFSGKLNYWIMNDDGTIDNSYTTVIDYPYDFIKLEDVTGIKEVSADNKLNKGCYDLSGRHVDMSNMKRGIYIINGQKVIVR